MSLSIPYRRRSLLAGLCIAPALALIPLSAPAAAPGFDFAAMKLPPGFKATTYITGTGFDKRGVPGIPAIVSMTFDRDGNLYFARTANRLREIYGSESARVYRIPAGPANITPDKEASIVFGPRLPDPDELAVNAKGEVFVSASRGGVGSLYRLTSNGEAKLFAGGERTATLLQDPEGIAFDPAGHVYVADDDLGVVVKLDPGGQVLDPKFVSGVGRARVLTYDPRGFLWLGSDGPLEGPHMDGYGAIFRVSLPDGKSTKLHSGPLASGMSLSPGGNLFVAQRRSGKLFALTPQGKRVDFAGFGRGAALRTLAFAPDTPQTRRLGIAGDLFVMVFPELDYPVREIIRISGPFDDFVKRGR